MADWQVQQLQAVWFTSAAEPNLVPAAYELMTGTPFQQMQTAVLPPPQQGRAAIATGSDEDLSYRVSSQPGRFDMFLTGVDRPSNAMPLLKDLDPLFAKVQEAAVRVKDIVGQANRFAVVTNFVLPFVSQEEATNKLLDLLGFDLDPSSTSDLSVQINRRREVDETLALNRLMKWQVDQFHAISITVGAAAPTVGITFFAAFHCDVNTVPTARSFAPAEHAGVFELLCSEVSALSRDKTLSFLRSV